MTAGHQSQSTQEKRPQMISMPEEEDLQATHVDFHRLRSPRAMLRRSASTQPASSPVNRGSSFSVLSHASKMHSSQWARRSTQAAGADSNRVMARHGSIIGRRALGRQLSMGQGKRLSARALLGAFGPMGLSAVLFDLQGKIDPDQLQAAQVSTALRIKNSLTNCFCWHLPHSCPLKDFKQYAGCIYCVWFFPIAVSMSNAHV